MQRASWPLSYNFISSPSSLNFMDTKKKNKIRRHTWTQTWTASWEQNKNEEKLVHLISSQETSCGECTKSNKKCILCSRSSTLQWRLNESTCGVKQFKSQLTGQQQRQQQQLYNGLYNGLSERVLQQGREERESKTTFWPSNAKFLHISGAKMT